MKIELRLFAGLAAERASGEPREVEVPANATLGELLDCLPSTPESVHLIIVNGRVTHDLAQRLAEGDRVSLFPPTGGG